MLVTVVREDLFSRIGTPLRYSDETHRADVHHTHVTTATAAAIATTRYYATVITIPITIVLCWLVPISLTLALLVLLIFLTFPPI